MYAEGGSCCEREYHKVRSRLHWAAHRERMEGEQLTTRAMCLEWTVEGEEEDQA